MKRDIALSLLTKDKWVLSLTEFNHLVEVHDDLMMKGLEFNQHNIYENIAPGLCEQVDDVIKQHGMDVIKNEIIIRLLLNGSIEDDYFTCGPVVETL